MKSLGEQLQSLQGRVRLMCIGNPDGGDDAFGVRLGEELASKGVKDVVIAGTKPESFVARDISRGCEHLIFIDAVDFGAAPGSVVFLNSDEMTSRFPQISTHRLSLGLLAKWAESGGGAKAWLLGVQPESLAPGHQLSRSVQTAMAAIEELLVRQFNTGASAC